MRSNELIANNKSHFMNTHLNYWKITMESCKALPVSSKMSIFEHDASANIKIGNLIQSDQSIAVVATNLTIDMMDMVENRFMTRNETVMNNFANC